MLAFAKGHGTLNDFVLLTDADDTASPTDDEVRFLCDRRAGIGADGLLRAVKGRHVPGWAGDPEAWFMDYRNADGSTAQMCGNGLRVFLRYLREEELIDHDAGTATVGTRAGPRTGNFLSGGEVRVWMGRPRLLRGSVAVRVATRCWPAQAVDVGNPHAVVLLAAGESLDTLDLERPPVSEPAHRFPEGVNVEFAELRGEDGIRMRVHERGVGETPSCGTGAVAVAATVAASGGRGHASYHVEVPGGGLRVDLRDNDAWLTGPAVIVARGEVRLPERRSARQGRPA